MRYPDCWYDDTAYFNEHGYAYLFQKGKAPIRAHRFVYQKFYGSIPRSCSLDHMCRNRGCVNPYHMRPMTQRENLLAPGSKSPAAIHAAVTECPRGHEYTASNTSIRLNGSRRCKACHRIEEKDRTTRNSARKANPTSDAADHRAQGKL